jgi:antitoxin component of MazEF toxin-antitoxin module
MDIHWNLLVEHFKIAKWGNSFAVRIPAKMMKEMGLKEGDFLPREHLTKGEALRAELIAERERNKMTREEGLASIRAARKLFPKDLKPEDWKIDRNAPDMRG